MNEKRITLPLDEETVRDLRAGDKVLLSGEMLTARDAAHRRFDETRMRGEELPVDLAGETVYYMGPSPAKEGQIIGSAGPTTAGRMDKYTPALLKAGLRGMIGKGRRSDAVKNAMREYGAVYFAAIGGCGALLSTCITASEVVCYEDLGTEAVRRITVKDFPCIVAVDCLGGDLYQSANQE